jgi:hypothetical protein
VNDAQPATCSLHGDEIVVEEGGPDKPTLHGRHYCPSCQESFMRALDETNLGRVTFLPTPRGKIMGVDHDFAPGGSQDTPLRGQPCDPPCSLACLVTGGVHHTAESLRAAALAELVEDLFEDEA